MVSMREKSIPHPQPLSQEERESTDRGGEGEKIAEACFEAL